MASKSKTFDPLRTPPRVLLANFYPFKAGEIARERWSRSNLFLPATQGRGRVLVGPHTFELEGGQILHVPWAAPLRYEADKRDPFVLIGVHFAYAPWGMDRMSEPLHSVHGVSLEQERLEEPPTPQPFDAPFVLYPPPSSQLIDSAIAIANAFERRPDPRSTEEEARLRGLALSFLTSFLSCVHGEVRPDPAPHPHAGTVREMISWMELSFARTTTRAELAERAGMSESSLASAFRAVTGKAPIDYLIDVRLAHARRLLSTSHRRVGEIAARVGIPDVYYFSKLFKRRHGVSPMQFRKQRQL